MRTSVRDSVVSILCFSFLVSTATAQSFTSLHNFDGDGAYPFSGVVSSGQTLYGVAQGGTMGFGTVFKVNNDGSDFTTLHNFEDLNIDGGYPTGALILSGNRLFGTCQQGGVVFAIDTDGTGFTNLCKVTGALIGRLLLLGKTLYGTAIVGGTSHSGIVFRLNTDGTDFSVIYSFSATSGPFGTNSDGATPTAGLVLSRNSFYGTAFYGGDSGVGTVYKVEKDGSGFATLHSFTAGSGSFSSNGYTNTEGAYPWAALISSGKVLYGTALFGGSSGVGTVFKLGTDGSDFSVLHTFTGGKDGSYPWAELILLGNTLYGAAQGGGISGVGTLFSLRTDGTEFTILHSFAAPSGAHSYGLVLQGNSLYGTTGFGGSSDMGTVFSVSLRRN